VALVVVAVAVAAAKAAVVTDVSLQGGVRWWTTMTSGRCVVSGA